MCTPLNHPSSKIPIEHVTLSDGVVQKMWEFAEAYHKDGYAVNSMIK